MGLEWDGPTQVPSRVVPVAPRAGRAVPGPGLISLAQREGGEELFPFRLPLPFRLRALQCSSHGSAAVRESHQYFMELLPPGEGLLSAPAFCCSYQQGTSDFPPAAPSRSPWSSPFHLGKYPCAFQELRSLESLRFHPWHLPGAAGVSRDKPPAPGWVTEPSHIPKSTSSSGDVPTAWLDPTFPAQPHPSRRSQLAPEPSRSQG